MNHVVNENIIKTKLRERFDTRECFNEKGRCSVFNKHKFIICMYTVTSVMIHPE